MHFQTVLWKSFYKRENVFATQVRLWGVSLTPQAAFAYFIQVAPVCAAIKNETCGI